MGTVARRAFIVLATLAGLAVLWQMRIALVLFFLSLAIAAAFRPLIDWWEQRGLPRLPAMLLTYLPVLVVIVALLLVFGGILLDDIRLASDNFLLDYERLKVEWPQSESTFRQLLAEQLPPSNELYTLFTGSLGGAATLLLSNVAGNVAGLVSNLGIILILSVYWSLDRVHFERVWLSLLPVGKRARARDIWRDVEQGVGSWIRSQVGRSLGAVFLLGLGYWSMGFTYPALLAVTGALLRLLPWVGIGLALLVPLLATLQRGLDLGFLGALYTLLALLLLETVVRPSYLAQKRYSSLLMALTGIAMAQAFGLVGLLLAPFLAIALQILSGHLIQPITAMSSVRRGAVFDIRALDSKLAALHEELDQREEAPPELRNLVQRMDELTEQAKWVLVPKSQEEQQPAAGES
ncbi:MAG: AI-2E family transporter [Anaerolineales bacterium]